MSLSYGWEEPPDYNHVLAWPWQGMGVGTPSMCETAFDLPKWHWTHDQWDTSSCVGHVIAFERALVNSRQAAMLRPGKSERRYDPVWAWEKGKEIDGLAYSDPADYQTGTTLRAGYEAVRQLGIPRVDYVKRMVEITNDVALDVPRGAIRSRTPFEAGGITQYRWATSVDEVRAAVATGHAVAIGGRWDPAWDHPIVSSSGEWRLPDEETPLGMGYLGHVVCIFGGSDAREAFLFKTSWGSLYPICWMPYICVERILSAGGEAAIVTDR